MYRSCKMDTWHNTSTHTPGFTHLQTRKTHGKTVFVFHPHDYLASYNQNGNKHMHNSLYTVMFTAVQLCHWNEWTN